MYNRQQVPDFEMLYISWRTSTNEMQSLLKEMHSKAYEYHLTIT
jgi:hypothetical protein